jgi:hypothetical protein
LVPALPLKPLALRGYEKTLLPEAREQGQNTPNSRALVYAVKQPTLAMIVSLLSASPTCCALTERLCTRHRRCSRVLGHATVARPPNYCYPRHGSRSCRYPERTPVAVRSRLRRGKLRREQGTDGAVSILWGTVIAVSTWLAFAFDLLLVVFVGSSGWLLCEWLWECLKPRSRAQRRQARPPMRQRNRRQHHP